MWLASTNRIFLIHDQHAWLGVANNLTFGFRWVTLQPACHRGQGWTPIKQEQRELLFVLCGLSVSDCPLGLCVIVFFGFCRLISASRCRVFQLSANNTSTRRCPIGQCCPFFSPPSFLCLLQYILFIPFLTASSSPVIYSFAHSFICSLSYSFVHIVGTVFYYSIILNGSVIFVVKLLQTIALSLLWLRFGVVLAA